ncbi:MAG: adventurous gliding motility lipoprotein CglB, partial [Myxococcaceae bacterium]
LLGVWVVFLGGGLLAGCQTYDFEPVEPLALAQTTRTIPVAGRRPKPNLMLVIDKSGSMDDPIDRDDPDCVRGGAVCGDNNECNPAICPTRWSELKSAMGPFLASNGNLGRMGALLYPRDSVCAHSTLGDIAVHIPASQDVDSELQAAADKIRDQINGIDPSGGTPTGNTLQGISQYPPLLDATRQNFIVLLTDGLPNCNANHPISYKVDPTACRCTLAGASSCNFFDRQSCLDDQNSVAQVANLKASGIKTIVIGFGAETAAGDGPAALNAMAEAGGFARACPNGTDAECGGTPGACSLATKLCAQKFYQAANGDELAKALEDISGIFDQDPCLYQLETQPTDPAYLTVKVGGTTRPRGPDTWRYDAGYVKFQGALCDTLKFATTDDPIEVEFRVVESL